KKVLALVLAFACAFTMFAGAAFTDEADIKATDAVNMLTALGVIEGNPDGSFKPDATVTRAEMAKMIFVVRNNTIDDSAYENNSSKMTDISSHWAKGYIKFCESQGIIAGYGDNTFRPDATVTGVEAAKMLLVLAGYDADKAGLVGHDWSTNTLRYAGSAGILDDVGSGLESGLPRQYAAQMIYNTLDTNRVKWSTDSDSFDDVLNGGIKETVGYAYMGLTKSVGTLVSIDQDALTLVQTSSDQQESDPVDAVWGAGAWTYGYADEFTKVDTDYTSLLGQKVKVLFKDKKTNQVLGVAPLGGNEIITVNANQVEKDGDKIKVDGKSYTMEWYNAGTNTTVKDDIAVYRTTVDGAAVATNWDSNDFDKRNLKQDASKMTFVDSDGNGRLDAVIVDEINVAKTSYVGSSSVIVGNESYDFDEENIDENIAKDDWAVISYNRFDGCKDIVKADSITGKLTNVKTSKNADKNEFYQYMIDGEWYNSAVLTNGTAVNYNNTDINSARAGDSVSAVLYNGVVFMIKRTSDANGTLTDVALVVSKDDDKLAGKQMKLRFFDGSSQVVDFDTDSEHLAWTSVNEGGVYAYDISDGDYMMAALNDEDDYYNDYTWLKGAAVTYNGSNTTIGNLKIADDAKIVLWTPGDSKVITGKQFTSTIGTADMPTADTSLIAAFKAEMSGLNRIGAAAFKVAKLPSSLITKDNYAYITDDASWSRVNSEITYTIWTGSENVTVREDHTKLNDRVKGTVIGYSTLEDISDSDVKKIKDVKKMDMVAEAVETVNTKQDEFTTYQGNSFEIDNSTVVLYVDSDESGDKIGMEEAAIEKAHKNTKGDYVANILTYATGTSLELLVVDIRGEVTDSPYVADVYDTASLVQPTLSANITSAALSLTTDANGNGKAEADDVMKLNANIATGYKFNVKLTGATFADGKAEKVVTGTGAAADVDTGIKMDKSGDEIVVVFEAMNVKAGDVTPTALTAGADNKGTYSFTATVDNSVLADNAFIDLGKTVKVDVKATTAPTGGTDTISVAFGGETKSVTFDTTTSANDVKSVEFTVSSAMEAGDITVTSSTVAAQAAKITKVELLTADGYVATTANKSDANTDATQIRITFDRAMASVTTVDTSTGTNFVQSEANVISNGSWNSDKTQITFDLGTVVTSASGSDTADITFGTAVKTAEGAGIDASTAKIAISIADTTQLITATVGVA
ncbi:S-layer homology domain-containing protein, partial [Agathobaculum sp. TL06]